MPEGKREILVIGYDALNDLFTKTFNRNYALEDKYHFSYSSLTDYLKHLGAAQLTDGAQDKTFDAAIFDGVNAVSEPLTLPYIVSCFERLELKYGFIVWDFPVPEIELPEECNTLHLGFRNMEDIRAELDSWFYEEAIKEDNQCSVLTIPAM